VNAIKQNFRILKDSKAQKVDDTLPTAVISKLHSGLSEDLGNNRFMDRD